MAQCIQCDKCGKLVQPSVTTESEGGKVPAYVAMLDGVVIVEFSDLCDSCKERVESNTARYIKVKSRTSKKQGEQE